MMPKREDGFDEEVGPPDEPPAPPRDDIAASCPVVPLGHDQGLYVLISYAGQVRRIRERDMAQGPVLDSLLGSGSQWAWTHFPQTDKDGKVTGFSARRTGAWLMRACQASGIWDSAIEIRQPGVWPSGAGSSDGGPIVHAGNAVLMGNEWRVAGFRDDAAIYPAAPKLTRPGLAAKASVAQGLVEDLRLWSWRLADGAPLLMTGWIAVALLGAAAKWRPNVFVTGGTGAGKTSLLALLSAALPMRFVTNDTSKAGLYQNLSDTPRAIIIDEAEGDEGSGRLLALIRSAGGATGALVNRGSADGTRGRQMRLLASVCMLAIGKPAMLPQDEGRFSELELIPPSGGEDKRDEMAAAAERARKAGPALFGRMLARFGEWQETLGLVRAALIAARCRPREADQLGALLAGYWTLVEDRPPRPPELADMLRMVAPFVRTSDQVREDDGPARCLQAFTTAIYATGSNQRRAVGELIEIACETNPELHSQAKAAEGDLRRLGVRVAGSMVWIANRSSGVQALFANGPWADDRWRGELARLEGARGSGKNVRLGPFVGYATGIPLALVLGEGVSGPPDE